jgi:hypothetical protein
MIDFSRRPEMLRSLVLGSWMAAALPLAAQQRVQLPARDRTLSDAPETVFAIGKAVGEAWEELAGVRAAAFDARDNLYVLDAGNSRVLVFDAAGRFVRAVGRKGEGPGELITPAALVVSPEGTIVVSDVGRRAFSLFSAEGTFLRNHPFPEEHGMSLSQATLFTHPRGGVVAQTFVAPRRVAGQPTGERLAPVVWLDFPLAGAKAGTAPAAAPRTIFVFRLPSLTPQVMTQGGRATGVSTMTPNWAPPTAFGVLPDGGLVLARDAGYRVEVTSPSGVVQRMYERPLVPRRGTDQDKERYIRTRAAAIAEQAAPRDESSSAAVPDPSRLEAAVRGAAWMEVIPVLSGVMADPGGRIWVARTPPDFGTSGPIDVLRADGTYVGTVATSTMPAAVSRNDRAAFIERDALGVEKVTVKRLPASWR